MGSGALTKQQLSELDKNTKVFSLIARKSDGTRRKRVYLKINHALAALYKIHRIETGSISMRNLRGGEIRIIRRVNKKRALNNRIISSKKGRPTINDSKDWDQMPRNGINEIE